MRTQIFYFSGTGNSLYAAKKIAAELGETRITSIAKVIDAEIDTSYDRVGIVFPVYMWGPPGIVSEFAAKLKFSGKYFFAVATCGGLAGGALTLLEKGLASRGIELSAGFAVTMPDNYIPIQGAMPLDKQKRTLYNASLKLKKIGEIVKTGRKTRVESGFFLVNWLGSFVNFLAAKRVPSMDSKFRADEKCDGCGLCRDICPVGDIEIENGKPKWLNRCQQCFACLQWCPREAIQYGKVSIGRKRYRNPYVTIKDMRVFESFEQ
jgi:ferredoxin/flavodoxin